MKKNIIGFVVFLFSVLVCAAVQGSGTIKAFPVSGHLMIDGALDEAVWSEVPAYDSFFVFSSDKRSEIATSIRVLYDDQALYFGIRCDELNMDRLKTTVAERDGGVWRDDSIELFLSNSDMDGAINQFVFNADGVQADIRHQGRYSDKEWNAPWQVRVKKLENAWTAEVVLPFYIFEIRNPESLTWSMNAGRNHYASGKGISHLLPNTSYRDLPQFLNISGLTTGLNPFAIHCSDVKTFPQPDGADPRVVISQKLTDSGAAPVKGLLHGWLYDGEGNVRIARAPVDLSVAAGEQQVDLVFSVAGGGGYRYIATVIDEKGAVRSTRSFPVEIDLTSLRVTLTTPAHHDSIFASEKIRALVSEVEVGRGEASSGQLTQRLLARDSVLAEKNTPVGGTLTTVSLELPEKLVDGTYTLLTVLTGADGAEFTRTTKTVRKLPAVPSETRVTADGKVIVNGKPIFALGVFGYLEAPRAAEMLHETYPAFNVIHTYLHSISTISRRLEILNDLQTRGKMLIMYPYGEPPGKYYNAARFEKESAEKMAQVVAALKDHPALLGYQIADEPEVNEFIPKTCEAVRDALLEMDPHHPAIMLNNSVSGVRRWAHTAAINLPDPYILPLKTDELSYKRPEGIAYPYDFVREGRKAGKPVWVCLQAFDYASYYERQADTRNPTWMELRAQSYISLIGGAEGLFYYMHGKLFDTPHNTIGLRDLLNELRALEEVFLAPDGPAVQLGAGVAGMYAMSKKVGDDLYVFIASAKTEPVHISFTLPDPRPLHVLGEDRTIASQDGWFSDVFDPIQVHVYTTASNPPPIKALVRTEQEIAAALQQIDDENKGNLAYYKNGAVFKTSFYRRTVFLNNGVVDRYDWRDKFEGAYTDGIGPVSSDKIPGMFVQIKFQGKKRFNRVGLYSRPLSGEIIGTPENYTISIADGETWREIAKREGNRDVDVFEVFEPVESDSVLIRFNQQGWVTLNEIRVMEAD